MEEEDDSEGDVDFDFGSSDDDAPMGAVKMEAADAAPSAAYDDDAALQAALDASNLEELGQWPGIGEALRASAEAAAEALRQQREEEAWALQEEAEAWRRQEEAEAWNRQQNEEAAAWGLRQAPWSPWRDPADAPAWQPAPAWPQEPEAPPTPPPQGPPAHLYEVPPYIILSDDDA